MVPFILALFRQLGANRCNEPALDKEKIMLVSPILGFALLVAVMALAGLDRLWSARTPGEKTAAAVFMAVLAMFATTLVALIVIF